jgi:LPS export ABC transporter protein LptC
MRTPGRGAVALVFLVGLAVGSWWLNRGREGTERVAAVRTAQPGYYLRGATLQQTDETGRVELTVTAERAVQDPATRTVQAEKLRVDYFLDEPRTWRMTAREGTLPQDGQVLTLRGDVRLVGLGAGTTPPVIRTERLRLDVDASVASTRDPVRIELAPNTVTARGMRADLKTDRLRLESDVHGKYTR